jgi:hypothetical protein
MPVNTEHPAFSEAFADWEQIAHCLEGQRRIKKEGVKYLPKPNASDSSPENADRYTAYKQRAVFHNVTARTVSNLVGQCFAVDPVPTLPDEMTVWLDDVDGAGVSANQQSKKALAYVLSFSRAFLWVDYPKTGGIVTLADAEKGGIRPKLLLCDPRKIINWRVVQQGAKSKLGLVVIAENYSESDDGFEYKFKPQFRVLKLDENQVYTQEVWRNDGTIWKIHETIVPLGGDKQPLNEIPGIFIGAEANDTEVEKALMLDISNLNIAHYCDSADYQEAVYMVGQPTPWISGLTQGWVDDVMKGKVVLGSRSCIPMPQGAAAGLLQVSPNILPKEAMDQKEKLMTALGAKLVEKSEVAKTATESGINEASETSILAACCKNVSAAYAFALRWAAVFANITVAKPEENVLFELNTDFAIARMTPEEAGGVLSLWQSDLITFEEARDKLKTGGWAYLSDEDAKDQLEAQAEEAFAKAQADLDAQTAAQVELQKAKLGNPDPKAPPAPAQ